MIIEKIKVINYKIFKEKVIELNDNVNIFVGENDAGKSTILEIISLITSGKINGANIDRQITANMFNFDTRNEYIKKIQNKEFAELPSIIIEAYCKQDNNSSYKGTNNSLGEDCPGISFYCRFNKDNATAYKEKLAKNEILDIPLEFYETKFYSFNGDGIVSRYLPFKTAVIDTSKKDYSGLINKFISENMEQFLSDEDRMNLRSEYRNNTMNFKNINSIQQLNKKLEENVRINDKKISINLKEENIDSWKENMEISVNDIPFSNIGFGSQNTIKIELALRNEKDMVDTIIVEEPENNLCYTNMIKLIAKIEENTNKRIFIATHSSFVANKLDLQNIHVVYDGEINSLKNLKQDTRDYFKKLPGYDTLRVILANKVILVEGPADELIIQRAYLDKNGKLPIEDGIDVITVNALAFKRYCDIALSINKNITIVTDNDGNIQENILDKYGEYLEKKEITICYEEDETLNTLEPAVLYANTENGNVTDIFINAISKNGSMKGKSIEEIKAFMLKNKTEWSMRVFDYSENIKYPQYIMDAIK